MLRTVLLLMLLACFKKSIDCVDYYTVIGSKTIKPNSQYPVTVSLPDASQPATIKLSIQNDNNFKLTNSIVVEPRSSKVVQFAIGKLDPGTYKLVAEGPVGLPFINEMFINLPSKNQSVFIQTDKAMYKPGDKVKFRVLVLDSESNPAIVNKMDVFITNAANIKIKQWSNVATTMGVYSQNLQLASNPPIGIWNINVDVNNERQSKKFEVAEYVLPKFEVIVSAPKDASYSDSVVRITVSAKYTYGKNVKGTASISVSPIGSTPIMTRNIDLNGSGFVEFKMSEFKANIEDFENVYDVNVSVTEALTGDVLQDDTTLSIRKTKFVIKDLDKDKKYEPGTSFLLMLQSTYHDGSPYVNTNVKIRVSYGSDPSPKSAMTLLNSGNMNANGLAKISITLPDGLSNGFYVFVQFLEFFDNVGFYSKQNLRIFSDQYAVTATLMTRNAKVNDVISIIISSPKPLTYVNYLITSRGRLISSAKKDIPNKDTFTITFTATFAMVPKAKFVAYYLLSTGAMVSTSIDVPVTGLNNFVNVKTSAVEKQPGERVDITVSTKPSSNVCLLGVDQSVTLLKTGNDIVPADVYDELAAYNEYTQAQSSFASFESANLFIITNAVLPPRIIADIMSTDSASTDSMSNIESLDAFSTENVFDSNIMFKKATTANAVAPRVRKYFPETWLWNCNSISSGSLTLSQLVPDTITSWYITGFSTNAKLGLGVTEEKTAFKTFRKFFISLDLPYSIKCGETIALSIVVFNYLSQGVTASVTLDNTRKEFEFAEPFTQIYRNKGCPLDVEASRTKNVTITSNNGAELSFLITPLVSGPIKIKVIATSPIAGDAIEVFLPVVPEGVTQYKTKSVLVDLRQTKTFTTDFTVDVPANAVKDSTLASFSIVGEFMGITLQGILDHTNIIRYPCGCGEQNMIGLAPDVVILIYLTKVNRLTVEIKAQLIKYLEIGYQSELSYMHDDGSFSTFGKYSNPSGSSWLTAFVIRVFIQASDFVTIDSTIISRGLEWLKNIQKPDGSFPEPGSVVHLDMQGQSQQGVALTSFVVLAFIQSQTNANKYATVITKALDYVKTKLDSFEDVYALAIACYAAQLANHSSKSLLLQKLDKLIKVEGEYKYWEKVKAQTDPWYFVSTVNIEITSYALLAYIKAGRILEAAPIANWLLSKQNANGGFTSTQDTVMAVTALAQYSGEIMGIGTGGEMSCVLRYGGESTFDLDRFNLQVLQSVELPRNTKSAKLTCTGTGTAMAHFSYQFNLNTVESSPRFELTVDIDKKSNDFLLMLNICTKYIPVGFDNLSNMAIIEAELPSGFIADLETVKQTLGTQVQKVETKNGNTVVVLYLDNVGTNQICLKVIGYRSCQIADPKPVAVQVYDYYNNSRRKTVFYQVKTKDLCGICVENDCKETCKKPVKDVTCPKMG